MVITLIELYQLFHKKMKKIGKKGFKKLGCRDLSNDEMTRFDFSPYQKNKFQKWLKKVGSRLKWLSVHFSSDSNTSKYLNSMDEAENDKSFSHFI